MRNYQTSEKIEDEKNTSEEVLKSLFWLTLSGTNALADQRIKIISKLLKSENKIEQNIGMSTLSASLKTSHFTSSSDFSFGARLRGYGWNPETYLDTTQWYAKYIGLCSEIALWERFKYIRETKTFQGRLQDSSQKFAL